MSEPTLVIRIGMVIGGTRGEPVEADVRIVGGRIAEVGNVSAKGDEEIDTRGKLVTPGPAYALRRAGDMEQPP